MRKTFTFLVTLLTLFANAQVNWQQYPGAPTGGFWDMDTLEGKLYVSTGLIQQYDGNTWTVMNNYNNSSNTPNKTKSAVKNIDGKLFAGAKDFNTSGEGTIHYLSAGSWSLQQNTDFSYNGSHKIRDFAKFNSEIYSCGLFQVPGTGGRRNVARWNGNEWVDVGRDFGFYPPTTEVKDIESCGGKLYLSEGSNVWAFNGTSWDSIFNPPANPAVFPTTSMVNSIIEYNNELYISGFHYLNASGPSLLVKYNGSSFSSVAKNEKATSIISAGTYTSVGRMGVVGGKLYFFATKTSDQNVYLVSYNGSTINEISKVADYGDFSFSPGSEIVMFRKITGYQNDLLIGGTFTKVNGQSISAIAHIPSLVGLSENEKAANASIHPNPANGHISVAHNLTGNTNLIISDATGREVLTLKNVQSNFQISIDLPSGIYFCKLQNDKTITQIQKLIIN